MCENLCRVINRNDTYIVYHLFTLSITMELSVNQSLTKPKLNRPHLSGNIVPFVSKNKFIRRFYSASLKWHHGWLCVRSIFISHDIAPCIASQNENILIKTERKSNPWSLCRKRYNAKRVPYYQIYGFLFK